MRWTRYLLKYTWYLMPAFWGAWSGPTSHELPVWVAIQAAELTSPNHNDRWSVQFQLHRERRNVWNCSAHEVWKNAGNHVHPGWCGFFTKTLRVISTFFFSWLCMIAQQFSTRSQFPKRLASTRKLKLTCEGWICKCSQVKICEGSKTLWKFLLASTVVAKGTTR